MSGHFTVTVEVKETIEPHAIMNPAGYPVKTVGGDAMTARQVVDRLRVVVSAASEEEAVHRALNMLASHRDTIVPITKGEGVGIRPASEI